MKLITCIGAGALILFSGFVLKKENSTAYSLYNTKWGLKKIYTPAGTELVQSTAFIQLNTEMKSAGGNGGCNSFGSSFIIVGNQISFTNIFSTKMYCEKMQKTEDLFFKNLGKVNRFVLKGNRLLLYRGSVVLLEFGS
jgi:heat shock protein HslJ